MLSSLCSSSILRDRSKSSQLANRLYFNKNVFFSNWNLQLFAILSKIFREIDIPGKKKICIQSRGQLARFILHGHLNILENIIITAVYEPVSPGAVILGSDLLESPQQQSDLQNVCLLCGLLCMLCREGYRSLGDFPALCGQDTRAASHSGPSGDTGDAYPFLPLLHPGLGEATAYTKALL